jgi:hypothetical protein
MPKGIELTVRMGIAVVRYSPAFIPRQVETLAAASDLSGIE